MVSLFWTSHHQKFMLIPRVDGVISCLNIVFLLLVGLVPFSTAVLAENGGKAATAVYAALMTALGVTLMLIWAYAWATGRIRHDVDERRKHRIFWLSFGTFAVFVVSIPLAFVNADGAKYFWLLLVPISLARYATPPPRRGGRGRRVMQDRAVAVSAAIAAAWAIFAVGGYAVLNAIHPGTTPITGGVWLIAIIAIVVAAALTALGWWRSVGFTPPLGMARAAMADRAGADRVPAARHWRQGARDGEHRSPYRRLRAYRFAEEAVFRGIILRLLGNRPRLAAVTTAALLFGLVHLANVFIRGNPAVIAAQALGAACFGFGYGAIRLRTNTLWPLIVTHMLTDLFLQVGKLPLIPVAVAQDIILLAFGLWLLRPGQRA